MNEKYYSWIPNLSSKINFQYITDEIEFDNSKIKVEQLSSLKNKKEFSLELNSSDQFDLKKRGYNYRVSVILEKQEDNSIVGKYTETILNTSIPKEKQQYVTASFIIEENGFIEIKDIIWNVSKETSKDGLKHKLIGIYSNIKYILHKDVHHDSKEDIELGLYKEKENFKYKILDKFILSIKAFERQIKDDSDPILKLDFYEKKLLQASGYNSYLKTYTTILRREASTSAQKDKIEETLLLANNIIESSKYLIEQYKNSKKENENYMLVILAIMTLFIPSLIASLNLTDSNTKIFFKHTKDPFIVASIYTLISISIGYYYTNRKISSIIYYKFARSHMNIFMKLRNKFAEHFSLINILSSIVIFLLIILGLLISALAFPFIRNTFI